MDVYDCGTESIQCTLTDWQLLFVSTLTRVIPLSRPVIVSIADYLLKAILECPVNLKSTPCPIFKVIIASYLWLQ